MNKIKVAFKVNGGFGTVIVRANFINYFFNKFRKYCHISIFGHSNDNINNAIFKNQDFCDVYYNSNQYRNEYESEYDLIILLDLIPFIVKKDIKKIENISKELKDIILSWENYINIDGNNIYKNFIRESKPYLYKKLINSKKNILNSIDIYNNFNISNEYILNINLYKNTEEVLSKFNISKNSYITLQRGANPKIEFSSIPKLWPVEYYNNIVILLKEYFPDKKIVQIGEYSNSSLLIKGTDINLVGKTDIEDLKIILKYSFLHIDGECGMVHLRKVLKGGPSIVLFGQTPPEIFGYSGNLNLRTSACKTWCAEVTDTWETRCPAGYDKPICMYSLTPNYVMNKIKNFISLKSDNKPTLSCNDKILLDKNIIIDKEWLKLWLSKFTIYDYHYIEIPLKNLYFQKFTGEDQEWILLPLTSSYVLQYLKGNKKPYYDDLELRSKFLKNDIHSETRMNKLIKSLKNGYNTKNIIIIDMYNHIMDGFHRASYLLYKFGPEYKIKVLRIYGNW